MRIDREQLLRLATFWLRPDFILRVVARFQRIAGFDRAVALASSAMTALIPLSIVLTTVLSRGDGNAAADRIVTRYELTGDGAEAVHDALAPATDAETSVGIIGLLFMLVAVLSFTRGVQRLFEQTWELSPLSVRNSVNGLKWIGGLVLYFGVTGTVHTFSDRGLADVVGSILIAPLSVGFLMWSGRMLSAMRIGWAELLPFGVVGAALLALYQIGANVYVPHLFDTYAGRYGVIGAVFAIISALVGLMVAVVGAAALGREVRVELDRIRDGIRPSDDEVRKQWDIVITGAQERWSVARERWDAARARRRGENGAAAASEPDAPPDPGATSDPAE